MNLRSMFHQAQRALLREKRTKRVTIFVTESAHAQYASRGDLERKSAAELMGDAVMEKAFGMPSTFGDSQFARNELQVDVGDTEVQR